MPQAVVSHRGVLLLVDLLKIARSFVALRGGGFG